MKLAAILLISSLSICAPTFATETQRPGRNLELESASAARAIRNKLAAERILGTWEFDGDATRRLAPERRRGAATEMTFYASSSITEAARVQLSRLDPDNLVAGGFASIDGETRVWLLIDTSDGLRLSLYTPSRSNPFASGVSMTMHLDVTHSIVGDALYLGGRGRTGAEVVYARSDAPGTLEPTRVQ